MKTIYVLLFSIFSCYAQDIADNPIRMFNTNYFDFKPLIRSFQQREISSSTFLVYGKVTQINGAIVQIAHNELRRQLTEDFKKEMLLATSSELLEMTYAAQILDKWRGGQLSAGELMSLDGKIKQLVVEEIEREKQDYFSVAVLVVNAPQDYLVVGKEVRFLALPIAAKSTAIGSLPRYDYGKPVNEVIENFDNYFFVTTRGFVKKKTDSENQKTNSK